jgi:capsular polysaccharide biosynthesis protein
MSPKEFLQALREGWWVVVAAALLCTGAAMAYSYSLEPVYEASATFVANPSVRISSTDDILYSLDTLASRSTLVNTFCEILTSRAIWNEAVGALSLSAELALDLAGGQDGVPVKCIVAPESNVVRLSVEGPSSRLTADLTNAIGDAGITYISGLQEVYELHRLDEAVPSRQPTFPNHLMDLGFGLTVGVLGGLAIAFLRYALRKYPGLLLSWFDVRRTQSHEASTPKVH